MNVDNLSGWTEYRKTESYFAVHYNRKFICWIKYDDLDAFERELEIVDILYGLVSKYGRSEPYLQII